MSSHSMHRGILTAVSLIFMSTGLQATFNFSSRDSRVRIAPASEFHLTTAITGWDGTLELETLIADQVQGQPITFDQGVLESDDMHAFVTAKYDPAVASADEIVMEGSDRIRVDPGTILHAIEIQGVANRIEGFPLFSSDILFGAASAELVMAIGNKLTHSIDFNDFASCTVKLDNDLNLDDGVKIFDSSTNDSGTVDINGKTLHLPGSVDSAWATDLVFLNANDIELHAKTVLTSEWHFSGALGESHINGNGEILDLAAATAVLKVGDAVTPTTSGTHTLYITDCFLKDINVDTTPTFSMMGPDAEIILNNVTISLETGADYTFNEGKITFEGDNVKIITGDDKFLVANVPGSDDLPSVGNGKQLLQGILTVNAGITLEYDTLGGSDADNIALDPTNAGTITNNGIIQSTAAGSGGGGFIFGAATAVLEANAFLGTGATMAFNFAGSTTFDGQGYYIQFADGVAAQINVADGTTVIFTDVVLKDFDPSYIENNTSGVYQFGDNTIIELARNATLTEVWNFTGNGTIDGQGACLDLSTVVKAITLADTKTLTFNDIKLKSVHDVGGTVADRTIYTAGTTSKFVFRKAELVLGNGANQKYTFANGLVDFAEDVLVTGNGGTFEYTAEEITGANILAGATLLFDRGTIFSYEVPDTGALTSAQAREAFQGGDNDTSRLYLRGAELSTAAGGTNPGFAFNVGTLVIDDKVTLTAAGTDDTDSVEIANTVNIEILAAATLDVNGILKYE